MNSCVLFSSRHIPGIMHIRISSAFPHFDVYKFEIGCCLLFTHGLGECLGNVCMCIYTQMYVVNLFSFVYLV